MSRSKMVPCPNGGRCGTRVHDASRSQYAECLKASRSSVAAMGGLAMPPSLLGSTAHDTHPEDVDGAVAGTVSRALFESLVEDKDASTESAKVWRSSHGSIEVEVIYETEVREDHGAEPEDYGYGDFDGDGPRESEPVFAVGQWTVSAKCSREGCHDGAVIVPDPTIGETYFENGQGSAEMDAQVMLSTAHGDESEGYIDDAVRQHARMH